MGSNTDIQHHATAQATINGNGSCCNSASFTDLAARSIPESHKGGLKGLMMKFHSGIATSLGIFIITGVVMSIPPTSKAAEIWPHRQAMSPASPKNHGSRECKFIVHNCEVCITQVGSGMIKCSTRSEQCIPTEWTCFEGIGSSTDEAKQRLAFAQTYANKHESDGLATAKFFYDRVPQYEIVGTQKTDRADLEEPAMPLPNGLPSVKLYHDRLKVGD